MKKYRIQGYVLNGDSWTRKTFDKIVEGESIEQVKEEFGGYDSFFDEWIIENIEEIKNQEVE